MDGMGFPIAILLVLINTGLWLIYDRLGEVLEVLQR